MFDEVNTKEKVEEVLIEGKHNLPYVRIKQIVLDNFKGTEHGEITLNCGKSYVPYGTESDILGVYGQNGSGKTSLISALDILKGLMSGGRLGRRFADCIPIDKECSNLSFSFDFQYRDGLIREVDYNFTIKKIKMSDEEKHDFYKDLGREKETPSDDLYKVIVLDEKIQFSEENGKEKSKKRAIIDTSISDNAPFGPKVRLDEYTRKSKDKKTLLMELLVNKGVTLEKSKSFVFDEKTMELLANNSNSDCLAILSAMRYYARNYLFVVDARSSALIRMNSHLPFFTRNGMAGFDVHGATTFSKKAFDYAEKDFSRLNMVLSQLIPGLSIGLKKISDTLTSKNEVGYNVLPVAFRDGVEIPLRYESDGVRRVISFLLLIIAAYNDPSVTVAIDEFDAGIFEYLLGEILQSFEKFGKGQFIFTSHNLRPLEVINRKFLIFTTTNPKNRYYYLTNISSTSNLRDTYFRELVLGEQKEELYKRTKRYKIDLAMRRANEEEDGKKD